VTLMGGKELNIYTGWENTIEFPRKFPIDEDASPDVATTTFKEFTTKGRGKKETMTLADLKKEKSFVMHGGYIIPYKAGSKRPKSTAKNSKTPPTVHKMFAPPANPSRRLAKKHKGATAK
jgi:hypothetical protein